MDCPAHAYLLPLSNYLAERSPWQPTSHAMNHASPHHRRRMRLYLMGKHICAPSRMRISSKSKLSFSKCIALTIFLFLGPKSILSFLIINYMSFFCLHRSCQVFAHIASSQFMGLSAASVKINKINFTSVVWANGEHVKAMQSFRLP